MAMAVFPAEDYVDSLRSLVALTGSDRAKRPYPDISHRPVEPYLSRFEQDSASYFTSILCARYKTPPRDVPSLCNDSVLSPVSTTCTTSRIESTPPPSSPRRCMFYPLDEINCSPHNRVDTITRWLDGTCAEEARGQLVHLEETGNRIAHSPNDSKNGVSGFSERNSINESGSLNEWSLSDHADKEHTPIHGLTELASTQAIAEFHQTAVHQLLEEFRQWKAYRNHQSGSTSGGTAPVSGSPATGNSGSETPSNVTYTANQTSSADSRKRPSDDDDEEPPLKRRKNKSTKEVGHRRALACPFVKRDQLRYRKCFQYQKLWDISRLKQHLQREHRIPIHCSRCSQTFKTSTERVEHERKDPPCQILPPQTWDGIDEIQQKQLNKRVSSKNSETENWNLIYSILFPESPLPESAYFEDLVCLDETSAMRKWFRENAHEYFKLQEVPLELRGQEMQMRAFLDGVLNAMVDAYADSTERASISVTHTPRSQRQRTALLDTPSDRTNSTPATTFSSHSAGTSQEGLSPCPQPLSGPLPSSQPFQALMGVSAGGQENGGDEFGDLLQSGVAPGSEGGVPCFTISEALDVDNSLGISFDVVDFNMFGPALESSVSGGNDDLLQSFETLP